MPGETKCNKSRPDLRSLDLFSGMKYGKSVLEDGTCTAGFTAPGLVSSYCTCSRPLPIRTAALAAFVVGLSVARSGTRLRLSYVALDLHVLGWTV